MNRIAAVLCPALLSATRRTCRRSDPVLKVKDSPRSTPSTTPLKMTQVTRRMCTTQVHHRGHKHQNIRHAQDGPIIRAYQELIQRGEYRLDPGQLYTLQLLQGLADDIHRYAQQPEGPSSEQESSSSSSWWSRVKSKLFATFQKRKSVRETTRPIHAPFAK